MPHPFSLWRSPYHALSPKPFIHSCPGPLELALTLHPAIHPNTQGRPTPEGHDLPVPITGEKWGMETTTVLGLWRPWKSCFFA